MTKADLVEQVADVIGQQVTKRNCGIVVDAFLDAVKDTLAGGDHIEIRGFGTFRVRHRKARTVTRPTLVDRVVERVRGRRVTRISPAAPAPIAAIRTRHLLTRACLINAVAVNVWNRELVERGAPDLATAREDDAEMRTPRFSEYATLFNLDPGH